MATADITARNSRASAFAADYATASLILKDGTTTLATHTLAGFGAPSSGSITSNAIADVTIDADGTCDSAEITDTAGTYTLTVGIADSGANVIVDTLTFKQGGNSSVNSFVVNFPASNS